MSSPECEEEVNVIDKKNKNFEEIMKQVFEKKNFEAQCVGAKGLVNYGYALRYMRSRATVVVYSPRTPCTKKGGCFCGFGLGYTKHVKELSASVFYIDLICTQDKMGRKLLQALEAYGARKGAKVAALRAATPALISVYVKRGYHRLADACATPSRAGRKALRELDKYAGPVGPRGEGKFTDGVRRADDVKEAWSLAKRVRPTRAPDAVLPSGWRFEEGSHGWWMSKCLV